MNAVIRRILLFVLTVSQVVFAQGPANYRIERIEKGLLPPVLIKGDSSWTIQERMKHYKIPGVSIAVINNFKIEWAKTYGVKDIETNEPVTTETLFQAGSISKPVAAMVALKKVQEGKLQLDEDINNRLTTWKLPENDFTTRKKVTLAHLLSHTGGLTVHGFPGYAVDEKIPTIQQILDGAEPANTAPVRVNMEPGSRFRYSGGGSTIAQLAIMDVEKRDYPRIADETVLKPLNMTHSTYSQPLPDQIRKKAAAGHRGNGKLVEGRIHVYPEMAAAGLWTTPTDLAKFGIEAQLSLAGKSNRVLSKEMMARMVTPFITDSPGLGFFVRKHGSATYFGHGGADEGFKAQLLVHRDKGYGAVVMVNSDNGQIIGEILRGIAKEYEWEGYLPLVHDVVAIDRSILESYGGRFLLNPDRVLTVTQEGNKLYGEATGSPRFELFAISETDFRKSDQDVVFTFVKGDTGKVNSVKLRFASGISDANRIDGEMVPYENLISGKVSEAIEAYKKIKREQPANDAVSEGRLNALGYTLLSEKELDAAIAVFKLNVELYPASSNVYDSLGEAYMENGDKALAIENYRKSLELNPRNKGAAKMLKKLVP